MNILEAEPKEIKKTFGLAFYLACKVLNKDGIKNFSLIYAFYRYAKDIALLPSQGQAKKSLAKLEEELEAPSHTFMVRLKETLELLGVEKLYAKEIISAARFEASKKSLAHHNQLVIYCYKNFGALALMLCPTLGVKNKKAISYALDMGIGTNLIAICANVLEDAKEGKTFLPKRELDQLRLSSKDLATRGDTPIELKKLVEKYLDLGETYLESSLSGLAFLPIRARIGVLAAANSCYEVSSKIRRHNFEVLEGSISLNRLNKASIILKTCMDLLKPRFWLLGKNKCLLHSSLAGLPGVRIEGAAAE